MDNPLYLSMRVTRKPGREADNSRIFHQLHLFSVRLLTLHRTSNSGGAFVVMILANSYNEALASINSVLVVNYHPCFFLFWQPLETHVSNTRSPPVGCHVCRVPWSERLLPLNSRGNLRWDDTFISSPGVTGGSRWWVRSWRGERRRSLVTSPPRSALTRFPGTDHERFSGRSERTLGVVSRSAALCCTGIVLSQRLFNHHGDTLLSLPAVKPLEWTQCLLVELPALCVSF